MKLLQYLCTQYANKPVVPPVWMTYIPKVKFPEETLRLAQHMLPNFKWRISDNNNWPEYEN